MATSDKPNKANGNMGGAIGAAIGLISVAAPVAIELIDKISDKVPQKGEAVSAEPLIQVPELYSKGFPLTIEQATAKLESEGFKIIPSPLMLNEAKAEYRDCFDRQVISSQPKSKSREKAGTMVVVRYVTQEVIDESRKIFECSEKHKIELKEQKTAKREKQREKIKQTFNELGRKVKFRKESANQSLDISETIPDETTDS